jgi:internalin A
VSRRLFNEFKTMMDPAIQKGIVDMWDDTQITTGARWKQEIEKALASTKVAVLLVNQNFLASRFITKNELPQLLLAAEKDGLRVFWIYLSSCLYKQTDIANYQAAHDLKRPLNQMSKQKRQEILSQICDHLIQLVGASVDSG